MFNKVFKKLGYKKVTVKGIKFVIKKLTPADFLDSTGVPFSVFYLDGSISDFGKMWGQVKTEEEEKKEQTDRMKVLKKILERAVIRMPKDVEAEDLLQPDLLEIAMELYMRILMNCMSFFVRLQCVNKDQVLFWDSMAKRYGTLPMECLLPNGKYTAVDAYLFNSFILSYGLEAEQAKIKKQNREIEKNKAKNKPKGR